MKLKDTITKLRHGLKEPMIKRRLVVSGGLIAAVLVLSFVFWSATRPERSVANYCKVYHAEKTRLSKLPGTTYPSGVFRKEVGSAGEISTSYDRLAQVAPADIQKDVEIMRDSYNQMDKDSSKLFSAGFATLAPNQEIISWTENNCKE